MGRAEPVMGQSLFLEYQDVLSRDALFRTSPLSNKEREELLDAFLSVCQWVQVYYSWRPNLPDEGDNHLMELAIAGGVDALVTNNVSDFVRGELQFPEISIVTPVQFLKEMR
jgi:predicted nucleic acid-binding protein